MTSHSDPEARTFCVAYWHNPMGPIPHPQRHNEESRFDQHEPGQRLALAWEGVVDVPTANYEADRLPFVAAEMLFAMHNADERPTGRYCPSMSVGDVAQVWVLGAHDGDKSATWLACDRVGFRQIDPPAEGELDWRLYEAQRMSDDMLGLQIESETKLVADRRARLADGEVSAIRQRLNAMMLDRSNTRLATLEAEKADRERHAALMADLKARGLL